MLYETIAELGSAIINYKDNHIEMIGFFSPEMLEIGLNTNYSNKMSHGIYPLLEIDPCCIKDNFTLIIQKHNLFNDKYHFKTILKDTISYKDAFNTSKNKVYTIRKCTYHKELYNFRTTDISLSFESIYELRQYFFDTFKVELNL